MGAGQDVYSRLREDMREPAQMEAVSNSRQEEYNPHLQAYIPYCFSTVFETKGNVDFKKTKTCMLRK